MPDNTNQAEGDMETVAKSEAALLELADKVFTHCQPELRAEGRELAEQMLMSTRDSKSTVRTYAGVALILSSLTSMKFRHGSEVASQYLDAIKTPMELVCSTPLEACGIAETIKHPAIVTSVLEEGGHSHFVVAGTHANAGEIARRLGRRMGEEWQAVTERLQQDHSALHHVSSETVSAVLDEMAPLRPTNETD